MNTYIFQYPHAHTRIRQTLKKQFISLHAISSTMAQLVLRANCMLYTVIRYEHKRPGVSVSTAKRRMDIFVQIKIQIKLKIDWYSNEEEWFFTCTNTQYAFLTPATEILYGSIKNVAWRSLSRFAVNFSKKINKSNFSGKSTTRRHHVWKHVWL